jgi:hypothetical protein
LNQAVESYLSCRAEKGYHLPTAALEHDPFLLPMIEIKRALQQKDISNAELDALSNKLLAARGILVQLAESNQ